MFHDRRDAGRILARDLLHYADRDDVVVLALPRGGVPVGYEVAQALGAPLDVFVVRKLGLPGRAELAMGAIASGGIQVLYQAVIQAFGLKPETISQVAADERIELERREALYRTGRAPLDVRGKIAIVVDDGLATGSTMRATAEAIRSQEPEKIVVAVPVGAAEACEQLRDVVDETVCAEIPSRFFLGVGHFYEDFSQTSDAEVRHLLDESCTHADT